MALKQFLKPDWRKIVVFVILLIPVILNQFNPIINNLFSLLASIIVSPMILLTPSTEFGGLLWSPIYVEVLLGFILTPSGLIVTLIYLYLISCLIIWIYDKLRKRK